MMIDWTKARACILKAEMIASASGLVVGSKRVVKITPRIIPCN